jgi:hypothetical protein
MADDFPISMLTLSCTQTRLLFRVTCGIVLLLVPNHPALSASTGQLQLTVVDQNTGKPIACRMHVVGPKKKPFKPDKTPFWHDHFVVPGKIVLKLPVGNYSFTIERGLEYLDQTGHFTINTFADDSKQVDLRRFIDMAAGGWWSGDLAVRRLPRDIELLMKADDLHVAEVITWRNGKDSFVGQSPKEPVVRFDGDRFYQPLAGVSSWAGTELLLLNSRWPLKLPAAEGEHSLLLTHLTAAREDNHLWVDASKPFWWDVPMLAAAGQLDSIEIAHSHLCREGVTGNEAGGRPRDRTRYPDPWGNAQWSQYIYFQLLECGLRIPPTAGSGSGESPNPVGYNRVYVHVDGELSYDSWWQGLRAGQVFVTNGPLLKPTVEGQLPGHVFEAEAGANLELEVGLTLSTREPISYLEIVRDGKVKHSIAFDTYAHSGKLPKLQFDRSGWFLIRAVTDLPKTYRFAMTGPYYVEIGGQRRISKSAAQFFLDWVDQRAEQIKLAYPQQQREVLDGHRQARTFWQDVLSRANAE